jgi:hypothetical protein
MKLSEGAAKATTQPNSKVIFRINQSMTSLADYINSAFILPSPIKVTFSYNCLSMSTSITIFMFCDILLYMWTQAKIRF